MAGRTVCQLVCLECGSRLPKWCARCRQWKPVGQFHNQGKSPWCGQCMNWLSKKWKIRNGYDGYTQGEVDE